MSPNIEFRQERTRLLEEARSIYDKAKNAGRDLTSDEKVQFDRNMDRAEALLRQAQEIERVGGACGTLEDRNRRGTNRPNVYAVPGGSFMRGTGMIFTTADGREIRSLRLGESIGRAGEDELPDGIQPSELSLGRLIRARITGDWKGAEAERRAMGVANDTLGGFLVTSPLAAEIIDLARNKSVVLNAGAETIPMDSSELKLAKVTKDPTPSWKVENAPGALSEMNFGQLLLNARTLMALFAVSVELVEDAANLDATVRGALAQSLALELDRAALRGDSKAASPTGVLNTENVQTITSVGTPTDFGKFSEAVEKIQTVNGEPNAMIYAPKLAGLLDRLQDTTHQPLNQPPSVAALAKFVTNQVPVNLGGGANESEAYVGDFTQAAIGMRRDLVVEVSRQAGGDASTTGAFRNLQVWVRGYLRADVVLLRPEHFCVLSGITFS